MTSQICQCEIKERILLITSPFEFSSYSLIIQVIFLSHDLQLYTSSETYWSAPHPTETRRQAVPCSWTVQTHHFHQKAYFIGDYKVRSTQPVSFGYSVLFPGRRIFLSASAEKYKRSEKGEWGCGGWGSHQSPASYTAHEAISSSLDPPLTSHVMECLVSRGCVCLCTITAGWLRR